MAKKYTIQLDDADMKLLSVAIGELPTKVGMPLANRINAQLSEQQAETQPDAATILRNPGNPSNGLADHHLPSVQTG